MSTRTSRSSESDDIAHSEPIQRYHDFYARLFLRAAIATVVAAGLSLWLFGWPVFIALLVGAGAKALLWIKHLRARRRIETRLQGSRR